MVMISKLFCKMKIVNICGKKGSHANTDINMCIYFLLYAFNIPKSIHKKRQMPLDDRGIGARGKLFTIMYIDTF